MSRERIRLPLPHRVSTASPSYCRYPMQSRYQSYSFLLPRPVPTQSNAMIQHLCSTRRSRNGCRLRVGNRYHGGRTPWKRSSTVMAGQLLSGNARVPTNVLQSRSSRFWRPMTYTHALQTQKAPGLGISCCHVSCRPNESSRVTM